ncbi:MAG TPA: BlaI/MecI/CopY family transcriptional regulator [Candidatus Alistipes stercorigallinarum]|jgi:predicted transcriptional regulator|uniref:BlaI/MecI/CopY family transcriptional regulator n=1 Tax=uncultured Alistipes sp. TaxID=538949 RepID=UPI001F927203|nr:BlaI/MecI/CopY family transcriptional regulator [uncultured Alistipes sp.]HJC17465.1 BlaI/MecI/CopY family transcriptional regulator [Candidatus Alistipes stercorigallinarum]
MAEIVKNRPQELTRAELEIMQVLWARGAVVIHDILDDMEEPKPAYNTVSTIVRILEKKGFVSHKAYGKTHEYFPLVAKEDYARRYMDGVLKNFFGGSLSRLVSFFSEQKAISLEETDAILRMLQNDTSQDDTKQ